EPAIPATDLFPRIADELAHAWVRGHVALSAVGAERAAQVCPAVQTLHDEKYPLASDPFLAVVRAQVLRSTLTACLTHQRRHLPTVIRRVIDEMLHHRPARRVCLATGEVAIDHALLGARALERAHVGADLAFELEPGRPKRREVGKAIRTDAGRRRRTFPALHPDPLGAVDVDDRIANRGETPPARGEIFTSWQRTDGIEHAIARPVVV